MKYDIKSTFAPKDVCKEGVNGWVFGPLLVAVWAMLFLIGFLLFAEYKDSGESRD